MVFNSHLDVVRAIQQKKDVRLNVKKLIRTDAALISALVVNGMLKAIPYAMRDDDEDESYWERWAKQFGSALSELWKPWELLPILRNIDDLASGRTIEQPDITASEASSYFQYAEPHGISVEVWLDYKERTKGIQNDKDANGKSIPYTAVQKIMQEINSLPISSNQKYALARSNGWAESTIQKYKTW